MESEGSTSPNGGAAAACAVCGALAATLYCPADGAALCLPCDAVVHSANLLASRHERVPLPAAVAATSGVYDDLFAADDEGVASWPTPTLGLGSPDSSSSSFSSVERSLLDLLSDVDLVATGSVLSDGGAAPLLWLQPGGLAADASAAWASWLPSVGPPAAAAADREARVRRYREKRRNRKFQKTIRYASRKAYAETRPRIKGRFVKRPATAASDGGDSTSAADAGKLWLSFSDNSVGFQVASHGVVPSF